MDIFETIFELAPNPFLLIDGAGNIVRINREAERSLGYRREELVGQPVEILVPETQRSIHVKHREEYNLAPRTRPMGTGMDLHARRKDGSVFAADLMLSMAEFPEGRMIIAILQDITERKSAEERQAALLKKLQESMLEIKALRGLLPICSHCKRIRDDHGFWQQVEVYIRDHSNAEFSHGICPECIAAFYPDFSPAGRVGFEGEG